MSYVEKTRNFLQSHLRKMKCDGHGRAFLEIPQFDMYARDYLSAAEDALYNHLDNHTPSEVINCISHLKRAIDCQIETFFHAYGLASTFAKRHLGIDKKLLFIQASSLFSSHTLVRLNTLRNATEHRFEIPEMSHSELQGYVDMTSAFVSVLEVAISGHTEHSLILRGTPRNGFFDVKYDRKHPKVLLKWKARGEAVQFESTIDDVEEFAFMMKVVFLLNIRYSLASDEYILKQLDATGA